MFDVPEKRDPMKRMVFMMEYAIARVIESIIMATIILPAIDLGSILLQKYSLITDKNMIGQNKANGIIINKRILSTKSFVDEPEYESDIRTMLMIHNVTNVT